MQSKKEKQSVKEPSIVIKPIGRFGGIDSIHIAMLILIVILIGLLLAVTYLKPITVITNSTSFNCTYNVRNGQCILPTHNTTEIKQIAESLIAKYADVNSSLSLLPYYSNVNLMNITYSPQNGDWYVDVPVQNPVSNVTSHFDIIINDTSGDAVPLLQIAKPAGVLTNNLVVSKGVIQVIGQPSCAVQNPLQIYWFIDPYSPGSISTLPIMTSLQKEYGSKINASIKILFTESSENIDASEGLNNSLALGTYLYCASIQNNAAFASFVKGVNSSYSGSYMSPSLLSAIAGQSQLNLSALNSCINNVPNLVSVQHLLAQYYNISSSPSIVTDCKYLSIPQTESDAIALSNQSLS